MYHSITFSNNINSISTSGKLVGKNTWDDWHLIPSVRPSVAQCQPAISMINVPGREEGPIDMTEYLTGSVQYSQRSGSFEFYVENDHMNWVSLLNAITGYLHGKKIYMSLEDDSDYYYEGRFALDEWKSESWNSKVVISYVVNPYKYRINNGQPSL